MWWVYITFSRHVQQAIPGPTELIRMYRKSKLSRLKAVLQTRISGFEHHSTYQSGFVLKLNIPLASEHMQLQSEQ
eukprot:2204406-Amphidinium_carterae.1